MISFEERAHKFSLTLLAPRHSIVTLKMWTGTELYVLLRETQACD